MKNGWQKWVIGALSTICLVVTGAFWTATMADVDANATAIKEMTVAVTEARVRDEGIRIQLQNIERTLARLELRVSPCPERHP
jgi:hypothetical protein